MALRYRLTLACSLLCAAGVAVLWGANISVVFPFVEVVLEGKTAQEWVDGNLAKADTSIAKDTAALERLRAELLETPLAQRREVGVRIEQLEGDVAIERKAAEWYAWVRPYIYDHLPTTTFGTMAAVIAFLLVGTILKNIFLIGDNILAARLAHRTTFDLRKLFYRRTLRMDLDTFQNDGTTDLMSRFTFDMEQVAGGLLALFGKLVREPLKMVVCLAGAAVICWRLLLLSLVIAPLAGFLVGILAKTLKRANHRAMEEMAQIYATLEETLRSIKIVKAFTNERQERHQFHLRSKKYYRDAMRIARYDSLSRPLTEIMGIITICLALMAGAWLALSGETSLFGVRLSNRALSPGQLLLFYALLAGSADPIRKLSDIFTQLQRASAAAERIFTQLDREPLVRSPEHPTTIGRHRRQLTFEGVDFAYTPGQPILRGIDLQIPFGETIAIVGPNGCGKSTLANLIPRFYDPAAGTIRIDGVSLRDIHLRDLRRQIGLVTQETLLFNDTVFNNVRYGRPHATREQVIEATQRAHAHQFIVEELADGYETVVGSMGSRLSGGQRQRISLARAILRDPAILILDEATSQVDLESEQAIQKALEAFVCNRTTIIITHQMSVLALADRIVVMQAGRVLDVGAHDELLLRSDLYRRLYQIQFEEPSKKSGTIAA